MPPPAKGCNNRGAMTLLHSVAYWRGQLECPHQPRSCNNGGAMTQCSILERTARVPPPAKGCNNGGAMTLLHSVAYWRGQLECPHQPRSCNNGGAMTQCSILERTARVPPPAKEL